MGIEYALVALRDRPKLEDYILDFMDSSDDPPFPSLWASQVYGRILGALPLELQDEAALPMVRRIAESGKLFSDLYDPDTGELIGLDPDEPDTAWQPIGGLADCFRQFSSTFDKTPEIIESSKSSYSKEIKQPKPKLFSRKPPPLIEFNEKAWRGDIEIVRSELVILSDIIEDLEKDGETHVFLCIE